MYILNSLHLAYNINKKQKKKVKMLDILKYFSTEIKDKILEQNLEGLEEIRVRTFKPIILKYSNQEIVLNYKPMQKEILQTLQLLCDNSIYSFQNQICNRIYNY